MRFVALDWSVKKCKRRRRSGVVAAAGAGEHHRCSSRSKCKCCPTESLQGSSATGRRKDGNIGPYRVASWELTAPFRTPAPSRTSGSGCGSLPAAVGGLGLGIAPLTLTSTSSRAAQRNLNANVGRVEELQSHKQRRQPGGGRGLELNGAAENGAARPISSSQSCAIGDTRDREN